MTEHEQLDLYHKCSKEELIGMLIESNRLLQESTDQINKTYNLSEKLLDGIRTIQDWDDVEKRQVDTPQQYASYVLINVQMSNATGIDIPL